MLLWVFFCTMTKWGYVFFDASLRSFVSAINFSPVDRQLTCVHSFEAFISNESNYG